MPAYVSHSSFNESTMTRVSVIVSFDAAGKMKPLYIGVHGEAFRVISCYHIRKNYSFETFRCQVEDHGIMHNVDVTYHPDHFWTIPKIPTPQE